MTQAMLSLTRRLFLRKVAQHAPAAAALAVLPVVAASEPVAALDPIQECQRLADELAKAMSVVAQKGRWRVNISHDWGYVLITDDTNTGPGTAHIPAEDMKPEYREIRETVDTLEKQGFSPVVVNGKLFMGCKDGMENKRSPSRTRLRTYDRKLVIKYLEITGRVAA